MPLVVSSLNFVALGVALWLGLYIVTRSQSRVAWLASGTLWALAAYFLNRVANLNFPEQNLLPSGLGPTLSAAVWYHLSTQFRPAAPGRRLLIPLGYGLAVVCVFLLSRTELILMGPGGGTSVVTAEVPAGPFYPVLAALLVGAPLLSLWNFLAAWRASAPPLRGQLAALAAATAAAVVAVVYLIGGELVRLPLPTVLGDVALGLAVALMGYAVARYNALLAGRAASADLPYAAAGIGLISLGYLAVAWTSFRLYGIPLAGLTLLFMLVIVSHTLYDGFRSQLDRLFFRRSAARLRQSLRLLAQDVAAGDSVGDVLDNMLAALCASLETSSGMVLLDQGGGWTVAAGRPEELTGQTVPPTPLPDDAARLERPVPGLPAMAAVAPVYWGDERLGYIAVGDRAGGYAEDELAALAIAADRVAGVVYTGRAVEAAMTALSAQVQDFRQREQELQQQAQTVTQPLATEVSEAALTRLVEDGLRHLHDFTYLGEHRLASLPALAAQAGRDGGPDSPLERGRAVRDALLQTLERLRPAGDEPRGDAAAAHREWHGYLVLRESYVEGIPTRDTMTRLALSEGTYNRTRRQALRGLVRDLATRATAWDVAG